MVHIAQGYGRHPSDCIYFILCYHKVLFYLEDLDVDFPVVQMYIACNYAVWLQIKCIGGTSALSADNLATSYQT